MATPPGGPSSYGTGDDHQQPADPTLASGGDAPFLKRFNFPSAPSERVREQPMPRQRQVPPRVPQARQPQPPGPPRPGPDGTGFPGAPGGVPAPAPHDQAPAEPVQPAVPSAPDGTGPEGGPDDPGGRNDHQPLVRPYAMTGGRTRPRYQLAIEALVHTTADSARLQGQLPEHQRICRLCYEIKSIAEISALLSIPLGVARILVADLAEAGLVAIHQPGGEQTSADGQPDVTLLERVLSGLRKL
ncbi:DUF742 domain-containing protein [Streptomyces sp. AJS327]|uniref:DUF742 domain-containing protein n=1 Tax=Streptomyces sp. AJS327 TaxID=2545265 RepID=UPI0015DE2BD3|nr:DUF742 domain-containing protein [Streptomyces sp. AJS327]MBA0051764.1 DUF742 domain-containing protein [Streptomyces sp. AJS327]